MPSSVFLCHLTELRDTFETWQIFNALCIAVFTGIVLLLLKYELFRRKYSNLWPGIKPRFLNILGNCSEISRTEHKRNGFPYFVSLLEVVSGYVCLFKDKPFWGFWISYFPFIFTNKAETVEAVLSGTKFIEKSLFYSWLHPWLGTGLLTSEGSKWKSRRKLLTPSFHFEILKDFMPVFNDKAHLFVKYLREETTKDSTDIRKPVTLCSLDVICESTLGITIDALRKNQSQYAQSVKRAGEIVMMRFRSVLYLDNFIFNFTDLGKDFKRNLKILHGFTMSAIKEKKMNFLKNDQEIGIKKKRIAFMDLLLEHHLKTKSLNEDDIREEVDTFAFEGHDTVSVGITWALYLIGLHSDVQGKIHEELDSIFGTNTERQTNAEDLKYMKYLDCVLKESQRLYPSVPFILRQIKEDTTICGYTVPKGTSFTVHIPGLHRDERWFPNPEKFDPDRFLPENCKNRHPFAFIPFSAGPRNCIGQRFAQMESKVIVSTLLRHYTLQSLDPRDKLPPSPEIVLKSPLPVRIKIRLREQI